MEYMRENTMRHMQCEEYASNSHMRREEYAANMQRAECKSTNDE